MKLKFHYQCPDCQHENNIIHIIIALTPFFLKCPHCGALLRVTKILHFIIFTFLAFAIVMISYLQAHVTAGGFSSEFNAWILIGLFFVYQVVVGLLICNLAKLVITKKGKVKHSDTEKEGE